MAMAASEPESHRNTMRGVAKRILRNENAILIGIFAIIAIIMTVLSGGRTLSLGNVRNVILQSSTRGIASIGQLFVVLSAGIDISIGGMALVVGSLGAALMTEDLPRNLVGHPISLYSAIPIGLLFGIGWGTLNGGSVTRVSMPPLIVTLAMWQIATGVAFQITSGMPIMYMPPGLAFLGGGYIAGVPVASIVFIVVAVISYLVLNHTTYGRSLYAAGGNPSSAWLSGVDVKRVVFIAYAISGFLAGLAGLVTISRTMSASMLTAQGLEIDTIATVVIGGASLFGGRGTVPGVVVGALMLGVIDNGMNAMALQPAFQSMVKGGIIFAAVAVDAQRRR